MYQHGLGRTGTASSGEATGRSRKKLHVFKPMGTGQIHSTVLKELIDAVVRSLSIVRDKPCSSAEPPDSWEKNNVTLISKKGKKEDPENYGLVGRTSVSGKITV